MNLKFLNYKGIKQMPSIIAAAPLLIVRKETTEVNVFYLSLQGKYKRTNKTKEITIFCSAPVLLYTIYKLVLNRGCSCPPAHSDAVLRIHSILV